MTNNKLSQKSDSSMEFYLDESKSDNPNTIIQSNQKCWKFNTNGAYFSILLEKRINPKLFMISFPKKVDYQDIFANLRISKAKYIEGSENFDITFFPTSQFSITQDLIEGNRS